MRCTASINVGKERSSLEINICISQLDFFILQIASWLILNFDVSCLDEVYSHWTLLHLTSSFLALEMMSTSAPLVVSVLVMGLSLSSLMQSWRMLMENRFHLVMVMPGVDHDILL